MGKKFVGLDGLKHFWTKAKTWIAGQITDEVTAKIAELVANENTWSSRQNFTTAKASNKMVIPIGAPSQLEDGCIWIER